MSEDLKARIQASASENGRSLHAELLARLEESYAGGDNEELQLLISRLEGQLAGTKFATDALLESASRRLGKMATAYATVRSLLERMDALFEEVADVAQRQVDGDERDLALAAARLENAKAEKGALDEAIEQQIYDFDEESLIEGFKAAARKKKREAAKKRDASGPKISG